VAKGTTLARSAVRSLGASEEMLASRSERLAPLPDRRLKVEDLRVAQWRRLLGAYDYQHQLERGYSVTRDAAGNVVRSASELEPGAVLLTRLADGEVSSEVTNTHHRSSAETQASRNDSSVSEVDRQRDEGMQ
jgi:exodeoxyribonuclease VII large subunit